MALRNQVVEDRIYQYWNVKIMNQGAHVSVNIFYVSVASPRRENASRT